MTLQLSKYQFQIDKKQLKFLAMWDKWWQDQCRMLEQWKRAQPSPTNL